MKEYEETINESFLDKIKDVFTKNDDDDSTSNNDDTVNPEDLKIEIIKRDNGKYSYRNKEYGIAEGEFEFATKPDKYGLSYCKCSDGKYIFVNMNGVFYGENSKRTNKYDIIYKMPKESVYGYIAYSKNDSGCFSLFKKSKYAVEMRMSKSKYSTWFKDGIIVLEDDLPVTKTYNIVYDGTFNPVYDDLDITWIKPICDDCMLITINEIGDKLDSKYLINSSADFISDKKLVDAVACNTTPKTIELCIDDYSNTNNHQLIFTDGTCVSNEKFSSIKGIFNNAFVLSMSKKGLVYNILKLDGTFVFKNDVYSIYVDRNKIAYKTKSGGEELFLDKNFNALKS